MAAVFASTTGPAQRRDQDAGREAHPLGGAGEHGERGQRLEPVAVGTGRLAAALLAADLGSSVLVEVLAEHDVVRDHEPVDAGPVVAPRGLRASRSSRPARRPRT